MDTSCGRNCKQSYSFIGRRKPSCCTIGEFFCKFFSESFCSAILMLADIFIVNFEIHTWLNFFFIQKCSIISLHSIHLNIDTRQCINTILRNQNCNDIKIHTTSTRNLERTRKYRELVWFLRKSLKLSELKLRDAYLILKCLLLLKPHINFVVLIIIVFRMARSIK